MKKFPYTLALGLLIILASEFFLFADLHFSHRGALRSEAEIRAVLSVEPTDLFGWIARLVAVNMTALACAQVGQTE